MNRVLAIFPLLCTALLPPPARAADNAEITVLREELDLLRADYERRISNLERRLAEAELAQGQAAVMTLPAQAQSERQGVAASRPVMGRVSSGNAFNPQTSVIINGNYYNDDVDGTGAELLSVALQPSQAGHAHAHDGHAHDGAENGFNLSEAELAFSVSVDPYFDAATYLAIDSDGEVDLEEAWFSTRRLPWGLQLKGGKFFSDFGYINNQHPHQWDFSNQNLAYLNLLGDHGLQDTGLQLTWLPDWPLYTLMGTELLQGEQERFGALVDDSDELEALDLDDADDGPRLWTAYLKVSPDLGFDHALQLGASFAHSRQHQEIHSVDQDHSEGAEQGLEGDANLWGLDLVYKYDNQAPYGHRDFKLQTEYLRSIKDLDISGGSEAEIGSRRELTTDGLYVQGLYGVAPRWQVALRYDTLGSTNQVRGGERSDFDSSQRWTAALAWLPTEFSLLRLQYEYSDIQLQTGGSEHFNALWLQFIMSMGTHGAHAF